MLSLVICFLVIACAPRQEILACGDPDDPANPANSINLERTDKIHVSIYVDATLSMQGYVVPGSETKYGQVLQLLESVATTAWVGTNSEISYYRFGTTSQKINRSVYRTALTPSFYGAGGSDVSVAAIDSVIQAPSENDVTIIVTDLYQKDADIALVQNVITKNYLVNGYAVGVLSSRSEYNGTIFDVGLANRDFKFNTAGLPPERHHPFYVIFLGKIGNLNYFAQQMQRANPQILKQGHFEIFYSSPVTETATLTDDGWPQELPRGFRRAHSLNDGNVMLQSRAANSVDFLVVSRKVGDQPLDYQLTLKPLPNALAINPQMLEPNVNNYRYFRQHGGFGASDSVFGKVLRTVLRGETLDIATTIDPDNLANGVYYMRSRFMPKELLQPQWWQEWNARENELDGSKTHFLLTFMQDLKRASENLMNNQGIVAADLCVAVQKR
ncbi:hypothetical protein L5220_06465 [Synechococcus sp. PCC 6716]|nr:hypothetical protein [Synechococcus sp. PCC 6716]